jgi:hypothetical protein
MPKPRLLLVLTGLFEARRDEPRPVEPGPGDEPLVLFGGRERRGRRRGRPPTNTEVLDSIALAKPSGALAPGNVRSQVVAAHRGRRAAWIVAILVAAVTVFALLLLRELVTSLR